MNCGLAFALGVIAGVALIIVVACISAIGDEEDEDNE